MANQAETKDAMILEAISQLSTDLKGRMDRLEEKIDRVEADVSEVKKEGFFRTLLVKLIVIASKTMRLRIVLLAPLSY